jgi:hypothetical protein
MKTYEDMWSSLKITLHEKKTRSRERRLECKIEPTRRLYDEEIATLQFVQDLMIMAEIAKSLREKADD